MAEETLPAADMKERAAAQRRREGTRWGGLAGGAVTDPSRFMRSFGSGRAQKTGGAPPPPAAEDVYDDEWYGGDEWGGGGSLSSREFVTPFAPTTRSLGTTMVDSGRGGPHADPFAHKERRYRMVVSARKRNWMHSRRRWVQEGPARTLTARERTEAQERLQRPVDRPPPRLYA